MGSLRTKDYLEALSMRLIERSPQRLTLQNQNHSPVASILGALCLTIGILAIPIAQPASQWFDLADWQLFNPIVYVAATILIALGAWIITTSITTKVSFDRQHSSLQIVWHRFWNEVKYTCYLHEIVDVQLEKSVKNYNRPQNIEQYYYSYRQNSALPQEYVVWRINLILASGYSLPLTQQFNNHHQNGEDIETLFSYIQEFLAGQPRLAAAYGIKIG
jgi:hypothetical protein